MPLQWSSSRQTMNYFTSADIRRIEKEILDNFAVSESLLMENAGSAAADVITNRFPEGDILVITGPGETEATDTSPPGTSPREGGGSKFFRRFLPAASRALPKKITSLPFNARFQFPFHRFCRMRRSPAISERRISWWTHFLASVRRDP